ncbi:UNVERIFIED_CONTAM: hypothetical protein FKN15_078047 [Acipenser sinensis]
MSVACSRITVLSEASRFLVEVLVSVSDLELEDVIERITDVVEKQPCYSAMPPTCFIFCGNFSSAPYGRNHIQALKGWYEDAVFHVNAFGFPPTEPSSTTRAYYGDVNFFGGPSPVSVKSSAKLKQLEEQNEDAMFVFVSDVWLDSVEVLEKIHTMFSGYSAMPPTCFIFCGNFSSAPYGRNQIQALKDSLKALADVICEYPNIHKSSRFVFVPGPEDPGPSTILPRPPLAEHITEEFRQKVPFSVFTTNPCRIQYCTQEMVVFREDLVNKMCRNCVRFPSSSLDIPNHFVKTILSQGHLAPLPLYVSPVYWAYDYTLRVYPLPDVIVFADKYDPFNIANTDCLCINPVKMADVDEDDNHMQVEEDPEEEDDDDVEEIDEEELIDIDTELASAHDESVELVAPPERSGHVAVSDGNCMYIWGGYKNAQATGFYDFYLPRNEIWIYNMESRRWKKRATEGDVPQSMSGSCAVCVDGVLYLFGGHHARGNTNRLYRLPLRSTDTLHWEKMKELKGMPPTSKDKLGCWVYKNKLVFFGGYGYVPQGTHLGTFEYDVTSFWANNAPRGWNNHVHVLDLETCAWSQPVTKGNPPAPRAAHACATVGNRGFVFGGRYRESRLNDLFSINMDTWEWTEILCLETAIHFKEILSGSWECLPKHLLRSISQRVGSNNTSGS